MEYARWMMRYHLFISNAQLRFKRFVFCSIRNWTFCYKTLDAHLYRSIIVKIAFDAMRLFGFHNYVNLSENSSQSAFRFETSSSFRPLRSLRSLISILNVYIKWINKKPSKYIITIYGVDILLSSNYLPLSPFKIFTWKSVDGIIKSLLTQFQWWDRRKKMALPFVLLAAVD